MLMNIKFIINTLYNTGIMNTMSIILVVYLGVHAGKILLLYYQCNARVIRWLLWAGVTVNFNFFLTQYKKIRYT